MGEKQSYFTFVIACLVLIVVGVPGECQADPLQAPEVLLGFADALFRQGDYHNAVHEYRRFLFLYPKHEEAISVHLRIGASYRNAGDMQNALAAYDELMKFSPRVAAYAKMERAETLFLANRTQDAVAGLRELLQADAAENLWPKAQFLIAVAQMEARRWDHAATAFRTVTESHPKSDYARLAERLAGLSDEGDHLPRHSSFVSGLLSTLVPGLGQFYNDRWSDGAYALLVVGSFAAATSYYLSDERDTLGVSLAVVTGLLHLGNIYGGVRSAAYHNIQHELYLLREMRQTIRESDVFAPPQPDFFEEF